MIAAEQLANGIRQMGLVVSEQAQQQLLQYLALLQKWNKVYNLTAVRDPQEMITLHLLDSLSVLPYVRGPRLLDVGSGAGLPGIVIAICRPDLQVTTIDTVQKKKRYLCGKLKANLVWKIYPWCMHVLKCTIPNSLTIK
jgi:16S rRNA (guanine527-N7)-methyltransferase